MSRRYIIVNDLERNFIEGCVKNSINILKTAGGKNLKYYNDNKLVFDSLLSKINLAVDVKHLKKYED